ncbi:MAG: DoxX family protein [Ilumatobacter sp.]|uniref:DoxX family protein n=1 Tax=Ilumatobacter sp. TaxID=1967498 RepID=UPI00262978D5|nr:DoxX family protein [Ilumatobacter sp.]MDJ0769351.1 DoxX family protein [Ilumatobacter sp.]
MSDQDAVDLALLVFRCSIGGVMLAHGINHVIGGGRIPGVASWFESLGMRLPTLQAWLASLTEIGAGALLVLGLLTPFGGAGVVGTMAVAWIINHRTNGFFIFRPGEGWEYVMTLLVCGVALGTIGAGGWSLDAALDIDDDLLGWPGLLIAGGVGGGGALLLLAAFWRPRSV